MTVPFKQLLLILSITSLTACVHHSSQQHNNNSTMGFANPFANSATFPVPAGPINEVEGTSVGGSIRNSMDSNDITKMSRAMDKSPGKSTHWVSNASGIAYTVTPIKRATVNGNHFCRTYHLVSEKNGQMHETAGTACVGADTNWKDMN